MLIYDCCRLCKSIHCDICTRGGIEPADGGSDQFDPYRDPGDMTNDMVHEVVTGEGTFYIEGDIMYCYHLDSAVAVNIKTGETSNGRVLPPGLLFLVKDAARARKSQ